MRPKGRKELFLEFDVLPTLPYDQGGVVDPALIPEEVLSRECRDDTSLRRMILEQRVPTIQTIYLFMDNLKYRACYPEECDIIALVYLNRLMRPTRGNPQPGPFPVTSLVRSACNAMRRRRPCAVRWRHCPGCYCVFFP